MSEWTTEEREGELRRVADLAAKSAAERVVRVAEAAATQVASTAMQAAHVLAEGTRVDLCYIKDALREIKDDLRGLDSKFVSAATFDPVKKLVYGQVVVILLAVVGAILALVIRK